MPRPSNLTTASAPGHSSSRRRPRRLRRQAARSLVSLCVYSAVFAGSAAMLSALTGCDIGIGATEMTRGDGNIIVDTRDLTAEQARLITELQLEGSSDVTITVDPDGQPLLTVTTDQNIIPLILTELEGNKLIVSSEGNYQSTEGVDVELIVPHLTGVRVTGSGDVVVSGISAEAVAGKVTGSGTIELSGIAEAVSFSVTGSGDILAEELPAANASVTISGSGDIILFASDMADLTVTGSGTIRCHGNPRASMNVTGSGEVLLEDAP